MTHHRILGSKLVRALVACVLATVLGCGDPVHDREVEALGGEAAGVPKGPLHRPGQPCVLCHSDIGGALPFSFAGTVYILKDPSPDAGASVSSPMPIENVSVKLTDSSARVFTATTNCAGNFFVRAQDFTPHTPSWVSMQRADVTRQMDTPIYREGSCAGCHYDPLGPASAGHVYLIDDPTVETVPVSQCH